MREESEGLSEGSWDGCECTAHDCLAKALVAGSCIRYRWEGIDD